MKHFLSVLLILCLCACAPYKELPAPQEYETTVDSWGRIDELLKEYVIPIILAQ